MITGSAHAELCNGLSRMKGNFQVRFLGEGAAAMPLSYPTIFALKSGRLAVVRMTFTVPVSAAGDRRKTKASFCVKITRARWKWLR